MCFFSCYPKQLQGANQQNSRSNHKLLMIADVKMLQRAEAESSDQLDGGKSQRGNAPQLFIGVAV